MGVIVNSFQMNPFRCDGFKSWLIGLMEHQAQVCCVVQLGDGTVDVCGNLELGMKVLSDRCKSMRRASMTWVPDVGDLEFMDKPLRDIYKNHNMMKKYGAKTLRHFIGPDTKFGSGECPLWEHPVALDKLKYCKEGILKEWNSPTIRLADVVEWEDFKVKSFGNNLKKEVLKISLKWRELCVMIIEVGYDALNMDVDTIGGRKVDDNSHSIMDNIEILRDHSTGDKDQRLRDNSDCDRYIVGDHNDCSGGSVSGPRDCDKGLISDRSACERGSVIVTRDYDGGLAHSDGDRDVVRDHRGVNSDQSDHRHEDRNKGLTKKSDFQILSGSLKNFCDGNVVENMTLQIIEIIQTDSDISLNVSDGQSWVTCGLDGKYWEKVESGNLKKYDIIKNVKISGSLGLGNLEIVEMFKPKSIQLKVCKKLGNPVPIKSDKYVRNRNNIRKGGAAVKMPRVEDLFDVTADNR